MKKILFISVDGTQNYLEALFLPVLAEVNTKAIEIEILEFCPNDPVLRESLSSGGDKYKIPIHFGKYFNKPPVIGSFLFLFFSALYTLFIVKKRDIDILMPRSLLAGGMALFVKSFFKKIEIIYESDGLMSDERVDFGSWKKTGLIYRFFQAIEKKLVSNSKKVIVRTQKTKEILLKRSPLINHEKIVVIPNGKNSDKFKPIPENERTLIRHKYNIQENELLLIYVGSIGEQYLPYTMLELFRSIKVHVPNIKFLILTPNKEEMALIIEKVNINPNSIIVDQIDPSIIANYISAADIGLALRAPTFSQQAVCPLKVIEYLMCGLPVITNSGIGDLDGMFKKDNIGYIIEDTESVSFDEIIEFIKKIETGSDDYKIKNRNIGLENFDLKKIGKSYKKVL